MSQKQFSEETGIPQSTISEWKTKKTNPTSEKIMQICTVLDVTPEWLLSGSEKTGKRGNDLPRYVVDRDSEIGEIIYNYNRLEEQHRQRVQGYMTALLRSGKENEDWFIKNRFIFIIKEILEEDDSPESRKTFDKTE